MFELINNFISDIGNNFPFFMDNLFSFLLDFVTFFIQKLFGWINLPDFPSDFKVTLYGFEDLIFSNLGLIKFFFNEDILKTVFNSFIDVFNIHIQLCLFKWILIKIPVIGDLGKDLGISK